MACGRLDHHLPIVCDSVQKDSMIEGWKSRLKGRYCSGDDSRVFDYV